MPNIAHLYYEESGQGPSVIFIHCPALSHVYWSPVIDRMKSACRCIALDLRGHGRSGLGDRPWHFADIAADLHLLTRTLGLDHPVLVGYSAGGSIAMEAALQEPTLYGGLVLVSAFSEGSGLFFRAKVGLGLSLVKLGLTRYIGPDIIRTNSCGPDHIRAMLPDAQSVRPTALASYLRETLHYRCTNQLRQIDLPVLLVYGGSDEVMHRFYKTLQRGFRHARAHFFPKTDHRVPTRHPVEFGEAVTQFILEINRPPV